MFNAKFILVKKLPNEIISETIESIKVTGYDEESKSFTIESPIATHYKIETGQFCIKKNNVLQSIGITSKEPNKYKNWLEIDY